MEIINSIPDRVNERIEKGYQTNIGDYIQKGFEIFGKDIGNFIGYTVLYFLINIIASFVPFASLLVSAPLTAGFFIVAKKIHKGENYEFSTFFKGFDFFVPLILYSLIGGILIIFGFLALIIPGIYLAVAWMLTPLFIVFGKTEFWDGMELSRKLITKKWWNFLGLAILLLLINLAGTLVFFIGLLFTVPITYCALYAAFEDIVGTD